MARVAYLILVHQDPTHFWRLVRSLDGNADFYVHLDAKTDDAPFLDRALPENVRFVERRVAVYWAGFSMVRATLSLIEAALGSGREYSHLVLLSGADYPIKRASAIENHLCSQPAHEFIKFIDMRNSPDHYMKQIDTMHFKDPVLSTRGSAMQFADKGLRKLGNLSETANRWSERYTPFFGSTWWALTPACCRHIMSVLRGDTRFVDMNRRTFAPDEHFFHTIVGNSEFCQQSDGLQEYLGVGTCNLANLHLIDPTLAKWFSIADSEEIVRSDRYFVRKVRTEVSSDLLDFIDTELLRA